MEILWLDNDQTFLLPHLRRLQNEGFDVTRAYSVSEAEEFLRDGTKWKLIIIDCMLSIGEDEESKYPPSVTDSGHVAGLIFFRRNKNFMKKIGCDVCVLSVREDKKIIRQFVSEGLKEDNYISKASVADTSDFLKKIKNVLKGGTSVE
jgi:CheY-like chemotaxis protein